MLVWLKSLTLKLRPTHPVNAVGSQTISCRNCTKSGHSAAHAHAPQFPSLQVLTQSQTASVCNRGRVQQQRRWRKPHERDSFWTDDEPQLMLCRFTRCQFAAGQLVSCLFSLRCNMATRKRLLTIWKGGILLCIVAESPPMLV